MAAMPADPPTPEETEKERLLAARDTLFLTLEVLYGEAAARQLWREPLTRKRGRKPGPTRRVEDRLLLAIYDAFEAAGRGDKRSLPGLIGKLVKDNPHPDLGDTSMVTEYAIAQRIRRALQRRDEERRVNPLAAAFFRDK
jgi:hypothetical protein